MNSSKGWQFATRQAIQFICALVLLSVLLFVTPGWALNAASGKQVIIAAEQTIDNDLYLVGETIWLNGTIKGDAVLAAREITVNGTIEGDLIAAGQVITLNGTVRDDARLAGQVLILQPKARIADDAIAASFSLETQAGSNVGGDLTLFANQALLAGTIKQNAIAATNALELRGSVWGNMQVTAVGDPNLVEIPFVPQSPVTVSPVKPGLSLTDTAQISGKVNYKSPIAAQISPKAKIAGRVVGEKLEHRAAPVSNPAREVIWQIQRLLALFLVGWLLLRVPNWTQNLATKVKTRPLANLGWGILAFLAVGVGAIAIATFTFVFTILFAITLPSLVPPVLGLGLVADLALAVSFVAFTSFVPQIILSLLVGRWLLQKLRSQKLQPSNPTQQLVALGIGLLGFVLISAIPVLGAILPLSAICLSLGALFKMQFTIHNSQFTIDSPLTTHHLSTFPDNL